MESLILIILCGWWCSYIAKTKGLDIGWAWFWGIMGNLIAVIVYYCIPTRKIIMVIESSSQPTTITHIHNTIINTTEKPSSIENSNPNDPSPNDN